MELAGIFATLCAYVALQYARSVFVQSLCTSVRVPGVCCGGCVFDVDCLCSPLPCSLGQIRLSHRVHARRRQAAALAAGTSDGAAGAGAGAGTTATAPVVRRRSTLAIDASRRRSVITLLREDSGKKESGVCRGNPSEK